MKTKAKRYYIVDGAYPNKTCKCLPEEAVKPAKFWFTMSPQPEDKIIGSGLYSKGSIYPAGIRIGDRHFLPTTPCDPRYLNEFCRLLQHQLVARKGNCQWLPLRELKGAKKAKKKYHAREWVS